MSEFYSDQKKVELRVGIIVVVILIILVAGYAWLRNVIFLKSTTPLRIKFASAQGIEIGDKVTVNGMEAGRVSEISQLQDGVLIQSRLSLKYPLREGARFIIQDSNLMGGKQLEIINSAEGKTLDTSMVQQGDNSYGMTELLSTASITMHQINNLLQDMNKPEGFFSQVKSTFNETRNTFVKVNDTIDKSKENLNAAIREITLSASQINELITKNKSNLDAAISMTPDLLQKTKVTLDSLQVASSALQNAVKQISEGKGTLPSLINDDQLYKNLILSTERLDSLLIDIKKNPKRYFKLKVF
jgi:phospholipid/cholesterol/gamma-HCH transport system substrate-binding protein